MKNRNIAIILSYIYTIMNMVCGLLLSTYLIRALGNIEYGVYKTVSSLANCLVLFEFGTGTVMMRNLSICISNKASKEEINKNISTIWTINLILSLVLVIVSVVFYNLIDLIYIKSLTPAQILYGKKMLIFISIYLIFSFFSQTLDGIILAFEFFTYKSLINIFQLIVKTLAIILIVSKLRYAIILPIVDMVSSVILFIINLYICKKYCKVRFKLHFFDIKIFKSCLPLAFAIFLQVIVNQANNNVDNLMIGALLNPKSVTIYSVGLYIYSVFSSLTTIPISMYAPQIIRNIALGLREKQLTITLIQPCRLISFIGGLVLFGFISVGKQFITIIYGKDYLLAWYIAVIIMIPMFINMSNGVLVNVLDALDKRMERSKILILTTIVNVILTFIWIQKWGIIGACLATAISTFFGQIIYMNYFYYKKINIDVFLLFKRTFKGILVFQIVGAVISLIVGSYITNIYISFLISIFIFLCISFCGYLIFGMSINERKILISALKKIRGVISF